MKSVKITTDTDAILDQLAERYGISKSLLMAQAVVVAKAHWDQNGMIVQPRVQSVPVSRRPVRRSAA